MFWVFILLPTITMATLTAMFMAFLWPYATPYLSKYTEEGQSNLTGEPGLKLSGVNIHTSGEKTILSTTIKLLDRKGKERYLTDLDVSNFTVLENDGKKVRNATVMHVEHARTNRQVNAILLMDKSGSMKEPSGVAKYTKMEVAKTAAISFVEQLTQWDNTNIAILPFYGERADVKSFISGRNNDIWWDQRNLPILREYINKLYPGGNTPLLQSLDVSLEQFRGIDDEVYKLIVCLTDGLDTAKGIPYPYLLEKARLRQIPIFTLCYGMIGQLNDDQMIELSKASGAGENGFGSFTQVPPRDWSTKLQSIKDDISHLYDVYWESTSTSPGTNLNVTVRVSYTLDGEQFIKEIEKTYTTSKLD